LFGTVGQANYGAAKAGIVSLTTITANGRRRPGGRRKPSASSKASRADQPGECWDRGLALPGLIRTDHALCDTRPGGQVRLGQAGLLRAWRSRAPAAAGSMLSV